jgi:hypothetical protein
MQRIVAMAKKKEKEKEKNYKSTSPRFLNEIMDASTYWDVLIELKSSSSSFLLLLLPPVELAESRLAHYSLSRLIVLNYALVPPSISRGAPRQTA